MKALSLTQPWATLVACGAKRIETRSWPTRFRGEFAIHASKGFPRTAIDFMNENEIVQNALNPFGYTSATQLPLGAIVSVAELVGCIPMDGTWSAYPKPTPNDSEFHFGDYSPGRYMYFMANERMLSEPIPCKGALGFWTVPDDIEQRIKSQENQ